MEEGEAKRGRCSQGERRGVEWVSLTEPLAALLFPSQHQRSVPERQGDAVSECEWGRTKVTSCAAVETWRSRYDEREQKQVMRKAWVSGDESGHDCRSASSRQVMVSLCDAPLSCVGMGAGQRSDDALSRCSSREVHSTRTPLKARLGAAAAALSLLPHLSTSPLRVARTNALLVGPRSGMAQHRHCSKGGEGLSGTAFFCYRV